MDKRHQEFNEGSPEQTSPERLGEVARKLGQLGIETVEFVLTPASALKLDTELLRAQASFWRFQNYMEEHPNASHDEIAAELDIDMAAVQSVVKAHGYRVFLGGLGGGRLTRYRSVLFPVLILSFPSLEGLMMV